MEPSTTNPSILTGVTLISFALCSVAFCDPPEAGRHLVLVQGGTFTMGDVFADDRKFMIDEKPLHEVTLDDFYISKYETTIGDFRAFVRDTGYQTLKEKALAEHYKKNEKPYDTYTWEKGGFEQEDTCPVVWVAWEDAAAYCNWRSEQEGYPVAYDF